MRPTPSSERQPDAECVRNSEGPASAAQHFTSQIISASVMPSPSQVESGDPLLPPDSVDLVRCVARALVLAIESPRQPSTESSSGEAASPGIFDSSVVPNISVERYLQRLKAVFECSDAVFVLALIIVDRLLEKEGIEPHCITMRNVHRLYLASLIVTVKYNEDLVFGNSHYARAGGIQLREVNRLERFFLRVLDYDFHVLPEQYRTYEHALRSLKSKPVVPGREVPPPTSFLVGSIRPDAKSGYAKAKSFTTAAAAKASPTSGEAPSAVLISQA